MASRTGQWAAALEWWKKVDEQTGLRPRTGAIICALRSCPGEIALAAKQVEALLHNVHGPRPIDPLWAVKSLRDRAIRLALDYAERALADDPRKTVRNRLRRNAVLSLTSPNS